MISPSLSVSPSFWSKRQVKTRRNPPSFKVVVDAVHALAFELFSCVETNQSNQFCHRSTPTKSSAMKSTICKTNSTTRETFDRDKYEEDSENMGFEIEEVVGLAAYQLERV